MAYESLRPYVTSLEELSRLLAGLQARSTAEVGRRALYMVALLAGGFVLPGAMGMVSFCLAPVALIACLASVANHVAQSWFMQAVDLHDLMGPRYDNADLQMALWATQQEQGQADGEA
jgi:hypothetical protein